MIRRRTPGQYPVNAGRRTLIRKPGALTTSYVLCAAHRSSGTIDIIDASQVTLWLDVVFGSLDSVELLCRYVDVDNNPTVARWTDLASTAGTRVLTRTASGGVFAAWMAGKTIVLHAGTNAAPGLYLVTEFTSATSITLDRDPTIGGDMSAGAGVVLAEHQELAIATNEGVSVLKSHSMTIPDTVGDGSYIVTIPTPGAPLARILVKGTGTATGSSIVIGYVSMPDGSV